MQTKISYGPAFSTIFVNLNPGDSIVAEADAMASMSSNVEMDTRLAGSFFTAAKKKFFGGESLFINEFFARGGSGGEVVFTQNTPGDIACVEMTGNSLCLQPGAFIAYTGDIELGTRWAGFKSMIAREGLFKLVVAGNGKLWFGAYGGIVEKQVKGEYIVDTSHLVAYEPQLTLNLQMAGGIFSSLFSGEGLVTRIEGNGKIYLQTRSIPGLVSWINPRLWR